VFLVLVQHWRFSVCKLAVHLCHKEEERFRAIGMTGHLPKEMVQEDGPREYHYGRELKCNEVAHRQPPDFFQNFLAGLLLPGQRGRI